MQLTDLEPMDYISVIRNSVNLGGYTFTSLYGNPCVIHGNAIVDIKSFLPEIEKEEENFQNK